MNRIRIKIAGQSGAGLLSTGEIIIEALNEMGFFVVADREYPSLIKGGHSCFTINVSHERIYSLSREVDVLLAIDRQSMEAYFEDLREGGVFVHGYERLAGIKQILDAAEEKKMKVVHLDARETAEKAGGSVLMQNVVLVGMLWKAMGFDYAVIEEKVREKFASKPELLEIDLKCLKAGFEGVERCEIGDLDGDDEEGISLPGGAPSGKGKRYLIDGNKALSIGAVQAGVRAYYAYPMSPASSILSHLALMVKKTGMVVKQAEDEITAAQMSLGSMFMGTRSFTATSGGGYDLMTETVSLAGIIENPMVVVLAQRPGPGTGLPTWTGQGDLNLAMHSSHGEFSRVVIAVSDPDDCYLLIQHAFNIAEKYQVPVIVLTEKTICESKLSVEVFDAGAVQIERGLVEGEDLKNVKATDRYKITENGLSKRWIPGSSETYYFANGDEHLEDGSLTEDSVPAGEMIAKRVRKMELIRSELPEPVIYGQEKADISFIGWGSSRNVMRDVIAEYAKKDIKVNYLHYEYLFPFKKEKAVEFFENNKKVCLIEGNYQGQFGYMAEAETGKKFAEKLLKADGRPFFVEDLRGFIDSQTK